MSVDLNPSTTLGFHRPLTTLVKRTLEVHNSNSQPVAFKVKTTAPKQYCVRPNSGRIEPGESVEVQVLLQPMKEDPPPGTKCRDKFLVQSAFITMNSRPLAELWQMLERENKDQIHEQKIRCAYLAAEDEGIASVAGNTIVTQSNGYGQHESTIYEGANENVVAGTDESRFKSTFLPPSTPPSTQKTPTTPAAETFASPSPPSTSIMSAVDPTNPESELRKQLAQAQAEIARLTLQVNDGLKEGLRQRNIPQKLDSVQQAVFQGGPASEGVPLKVVVGIVAGVFLFTWAFF